MAPREGSTEAPIRHPLDWHSESFYNETEIHAEMERVFDICHGCRRCFNLCDSFPTLFDLIDESQTGEVDGLKAEDYDTVADGCTLCDMCFLTKCPYVPPHEFNLDFPHLILRQRAAKLKKQSPGITVKNLAKTDRNGKLFAPIADVANWGSKRGNSLTRPIMEAVTGIDRDVELPKFHTKSFSKQAKATPATRNKNAPANQRKAILYATCFVDYNNPETGLAAQKVLAHNGVETEVVYPACCGMPYFEHGDIAQVAKQAEKVAAELLSWVDKGYDVIALTASCSLMMKFEWPLILSDNEEIKRLSAATKDISEYIVSIAKNEGLVEGLKPLEGGVSVHMACHARAQNMGAKAAEMLKYIPDTKVEVIERCSGHGGTFGVMKETRSLAQKVAKNTVSQIKRKDNKHLCSECPLACKHLNQELTAGTDEDMTPAGSTHPIELLATSYGL